MNAGSITILNRPQRKRSAEPHRTSLLRPADWECLARFCGRSGCSHTCPPDSEAGALEDDSPEMGRRGYGRSGSQASRSEGAGSSSAHRELSSGEMIPVRVTSRIQPGQEMGQLKAEMIVGSGLWFSGMRHLLTHTVKDLERHKWTLLRPPEDLPWFTSDDPVIRLNYYRDDRYDFNGGWGNKGSEIVLSLGPHISSARRSASNRRAEVRCLGHPERRRFDVLSPNTHSEQSTPPKQILTRSVFGHGEWTPIRCATKPSNGGDGTLSRATQSGSSQYVERTAFQNP